MKAKGIIALIIVVCLSPFVALLMAFVELLLTPHKIIKYALEQIEKDSR